MKGVFIYLLMVALLLGSFTGCEADVLPLGITEKAVVERGTYVVKLLSEKEYESIVNLYREDYRENITVELLADTMDATLDRLGGFVDVTEALVGGSLDEWTGRQSAFCMLSCEYENGKKIFRVIFDDEMNLIGIFGK